MVSWLGGWRDSRYEEVGGNEAPGEPRPPGLPSLIEGYALKILDVTIPSYAFAFEEIAQAVSERGHRRALRVTLTRIADVSCTAAARQPETSRPAKASFFFALQFFSGFSFSTAAVACASIGDYRDARLDSTHRGAILSHFHFA